MEVMDNLQEGLNAKFERLNERLSNLEAGSKEYLEAEKAMEKLLDQMQAFYRTSNEFWAKEEERRIQENHNEQMAEIEDRKVKDHFDIEMERAQTQLQVEKEKQKLSWKKVVFEMSKVVVPAAISAVVFFKGQERMIKFEETGRFTSSVSRESHLPNPLKHI